MKTNIQLSADIRNILDDPAMKDKLSDNQRATLKEVERALLTNSEPFTDMLGSMFKAGPSILLAEYDSESNVMTVHYSNGNMARYSGAGTVWNKLPMMTRCSTEMEKQLTNICEYVKKWGNPYPNAHILNQEKR